MVRTTVPDIARAPVVSAMDRRLRMPASHAGLVLVSPSAVWLILLVVIPVVLVGVLAVYSYDPLTGALTFVGGDNIRRVWVSDELRTSTANTLLYALYTVLPTMVLGLLLALAINRVRVGAGLWRTAYFLPIASTLAGMSVVWRWMFYPDTGVVDSTVGRLLGVQDWLNSTSLALPAVAVVGCWQGIGAAMVMYLAGLSGVPKVLQEAAILDGANPWHRFWTVTWPAIGPATVFALITTTRDALRVYDQVAVMTQGDPYGASTTLAYLMWQRGVSFSDLGGASAINLVLFVLVMVTIVAQLRIVGRRWEASGAR